MSDKLTEQQLAALRGVDREKLARVIAKVIHETQKRQEKDATRREIGKGSGRGER